MKKFLLLISIVSLLLIACGDPNELCEKNLQGTWKQTKFIKDGKEYAGEMGVFFRFSDDGKAIQSADSTNIAGKYTLEGKILTIKVPISEKTVDFVYNIPEFSENKMVVTFEKGTAHFERVDNITINEEEFAKFYSGEGGISGALADDMKLEETVGYMRSISSAIYAYYADYEKYPIGDGTDMIKCISVAHLENPPTRDSWGNIWIYRASPDGQNFVFQTNGKDGVRGPGPSRNPFHMSKSDPSRFDYDIIIINGEFTEGIE
ncbi:MAG: lipocalin family protein [Acidobacteria bacterium]|nr:lipocalin family protein [Acidobacteriota bacterium]